MAFCEVLVRVFYKNTPQRNAGESERRFAKKTHRRGMPAKKRNFAICSREAYSALNPNLTRLRSLTFEFDRTLTMNNKINE